MKTPEEIKKGLECCFNEDGIDFACGECPYDEAGSECGNLFGDALAYIQQLEAKVPRWISVEDELPEAKIAVLAFGQRYSSYNKKGEPFPMVHVAYTRGEGEGWFTYSNDDYVEVTHWMHLPEVPEV